MKALDSGCKKALRGAKTLGVKHVTEICIKQQRYGRLGALKTNFVCTKLVCFCVNRAISATAA